MTPKDGELTWAAAGLDDVPSETSWIDPLFAARIERMTYTKRRSETILARWAAKATVARTLGWQVEPATLARIVIRNAIDGAPEVTVDDVPLGGVIAMTDRADWAVSMVLGGVARVGCDLELVEPRSSAFVADYFTVLEQATVADHPDRDLAANLIWSAKESALKVMRTGLRRDTRTVEVALGHDGDDTWRPLSVTADDGRLFPGWWLLTGPFVLTCATEEPTPPPTSLVEPHGLADARPSHRWMDQPRTR
jgi:4'-phosphopantetheinyl transferase